MLLILLNVDPIEFEFGYGLIPLVDAAQGGDLLDRVVMIRRQLALELGLLFLLFEFEIIFNYNRMNIVLKLKEMKWQEENYYLITI